MQWIEEYKKKISYKSSDDFLENFIGKECFIITDNNIATYYPKIISHYRHYIMQAGEETKDLKEVNLILETLLTHNYTRNVMIIAFGGGIVCDIAGFVSAIYKRGVSLTLLPTSLIAMVDAAIGGKNGVNSNKFKNQFGTIKHADYINIDVSLLATLPKEEFTNGMAEVVKHGLLSTSNYYQKAIAYSHKKFSSELIISLEDIIRESIAIKLSYVVDDENDKGRRRFLNFGHTLGHAIEKKYQIAHGNAVLWGMLKALELSQEMKLLSDDLYRKISNDLKALNIVDERKLIWNDIEEALLKDKKRLGEKLPFILLEDIGKPVIHEISIDVVRETLKGY